MNTSIGSANRDNKAERKKRISSLHQPGALTDEDIIRREMKTYQQKKEEYLRKYEGKYIAMLNGEVLDSDLYLSDLATRIYEKIGYRAIYMPLVTRRNKPYKISSPKLKSNK